MNNTIVRVFLILMLPATAILGRAQLSSPILTSPTTHEEVDEGLLTVTATCEYTFVPKDGYVPVVRVVPYYSSGFFARHEGAKDLVITVSHILRCDWTFEDLKPLAAQLQIDPSDFISVNGRRYDNSIAILFGGQRLTPVKILYVSSKKKIGDLDEAVLEVAVPDSLRHRHLPILNGSVAALREGDEVFIRGTELFLNNFDLRLKVGWIEHIFPTLVQVFTFPQHGLSGGPVLVKRDGVFYVAGLSSMMVFPTMTADAPKEKKSNKKNRGDDAKPVSPFLANQDVADRLWMSPLREDIFGKAGRSLTAQ